MNASIKDQAIFVEFTDPAGANHEVVLPLVPARLGFSDSGVSLETAWGGISIYNYGMAVLRLKFDEYGAINASFGIKLDQAKLVSEALYGGPVPEAPPKCPTCKGSLETPAPGDFHCNKCAAKAARIEEPAFDAA